MLGQELLFPHLGSIAYWVNRNTAPLLGSHYRKFAPMIECIDVHHVKNLQFRCFILNKSKSHNTAITAVAAAVDIVSSGHYLKNHADSNSGQS